LVIYKHWAAIEKEEEEEEEDLLSASVSSPQIFLSGRDSVWIERDLVAYLPRRARRSLHAADLQLVD